MITAKQLNGTYPHRQMRMYIEDQYAHMTPEGRAAKLGALVKKFLFNFNKNPHGGNRWGQKGIDEVPDNIDEAFLWADTPEGFDFWEHIQDFRPQAEEARIAPGPWDVPAFAAGFEELVGKPVKVKLPKAAPKKRIGWWV